ncbi:MAG: alkaline phosphatase family protein [Sporichthyaceae bacterium]
MVVLVIAIALTGLWSSAPVSASSTAVGAIADAYVSSSARSTNYGSATTLKVDASPVLRSYLRFNAALPADATITGGLLRLYSSSASSTAGFRVRAVSNTTWAERTLTYKNAPALGATVGTSGGWSTAGYRTVTLTAGAVRSGLNSVALDTTSSTSITLQAREGLNPPQLIISYDLPAPADVTPPETSITSAPVDSTNTSASISFASSEPGSTFRCHLDGNADSPCVSPVTYSGLAPGLHSFTVAATDAAGNLDSTPAVASWTVTTAPSPASSACGSMVGSSAHISKVVWIWFENKGYLNLTTDAAPYLNKIKSECGYASNYTSVTSCVSLPEYIASTSGSPQGICDDNGPAAHPLDVDNVFRQIDNAGKSWTSYQEGMPVNCSRTSSGRYAVKHNPAAYYTGSIGANSCNTNDVPLSATPTFGSDFTIIEPDLCNSMHDCSVQAGDTWLSNLLPKVLSSTNYQAGDTAVFITFDEGGGPGGETLYTLALSPYTPPGTVSTTSFDHYSLLATLQATLGLPCLLNSCTATDMRSSFGMAPP